MTPNHIQQQLERDASLLLEIPYFSRILGHLLPRDHQPATAPKA